MLTTSSSSQDSCSFDDSTEIVRSASGSTAGIGKVTVDVLSVWRDMVSRQSRYASPFYHPDFFTAVRRIGIDAELYVIRDAERIVGFFPFQRASRNSAIPPGGGLNDDQGLILEPGAEVDLLEILKDCGLSEYRFHANSTSPVGDEACHLRPFTHGCRKSFLADLGTSGEAFIETLKVRHSTIGRQKQKTRRLVSTCGPLRLEFDCRDSAVLDCLIKLKSQQYQRTHIYDAFAVQWVRDLLHELHRSTGVVRGMLSVLYAGDQIVALHFGLRHGSLLHFWFPVYDPAYAYASPGTLLFMEMAKRCTAAGISAIDFGYGEQPYKRKLANVISESAYGIATDSFIRRTAFSAQWSCRQALRSVWLKDSIKPIVRLAFPGWGGGLFRGSPKSEPDKANSDASVR
jgi:CelD/BcsL family acetyltransferase involved in cellulose biosynthesis